MKEMILDVYLYLLAIGTVALCIWGLMDDENRKKKSDSSPISYRTDQNQPSKKIINDGR